MYTNSKFQTQLSRNLQRFKTALVPRYDANSRPFVTDLSLQKSLVTTCQGRARISKMGEGDIINNFFSIFVYEKIEFLAFL